MCIRDSLYAMPLGALALVVGALMLVPLVLVLLGRLLHHAPLSMRLASRDATRARGRTTQMCIRDSVIPNLALYLPLGIALALAMRRRIVAVAIIVATTGLTETYQALFTDRTCSRSDVLTNSIGGLVGAAAIVGVERLARRRVPAAVS